jgi:hypothetical protein
MRLTSKQIDELWGEEGPYSEVKLIVETRILDDRVSREFLVVEVFINPFTFKFIKKNRKLFRGNEMVQQLLDHSEYRGQGFGYVSNAFHGHYGNKNVMKNAKQSAVRSTKLIIELHKFVMNELGTNSENIYGK